MNQIPSTASLDLPPDLAQILGMRPPIPQYAQGGLVGPGGTPQPPTGVGVSQTPQQGAPMDYQMLEMHLNQFMNQNPQQVEQIKNAILQEMQTGGITADELNKMVQLATVAAQNPEMYPYVRKFAIQQGIATEQDLPQQYDQGLVFIILLAARAIQQGVGGQQMASMGGGAQQPQSGPIPKMASGGPVPQSKKKSGGVIIEAHEDEYVIPADIVKIKGTEFFDNLIKKYAVNENGENED